MLSRLCFFWQNIMDEVWQRKPKNLVLAGKQEEEPVSQYDLQGHAYCLFPQVRPYLPMLLLAEIHGTKI